MKGVFISSLLYLVGHLPLRVNHTLGGFLGWLLWLINGRDRKTCETNLRLCFPDKDPQWIATTARRSLIETGKTLTEAPVLWYASREKIQHLVKAVSDMPAVEKAIKQGKGAILCSPHLGCWEMTGLYAASLYPMTSLYRPPHIKALDDILTRSRENTGARLVPTTAGGIRQLQKALERQECIGILPDQEPKGSGGVFAPFFGVQAYTMTLLTRLASERQVPVIISFAERLPEGAGYQLHIVVPDQRIHDPDPQIAAAALNAAVEQIIRINPAQYMWNYKRFKKRPEGEESFYD
jgi:KDO2-lipid IV(A) lauroyltransferase